MKHVSNEQKAQEISQQWWSDCGWQLQAAAYDAAIEAMEWKDEQQIEQLTAFAQHLNKRGAFRDDLCMDFEHEAQSFIEMQKRKEL